MSGLVRAKNREAHARWWAENPIEPIRLQWAAMAREAGGGFDLISVDPPWTFNSNSVLNPGKNPRRHYHTAPLDWIKALPIRELAAPDSLIWLWATNPLLDRAFEVLQAWDVRFCTAGHWAKTTKSGGLAFGTGFVLRGAGEPFLIAKIGRPATSRSVRSVILGARREHSRKPVEAFAAQRQLMPSARRIEVFAREAQEGFARWGDETEKFNQEGPDDDRATDRARGPEKGLPGAEAGEGR